MWQSRMVLNLGLVGLFFFLKKVTSWGWERETIHLHEMHL